MTIDEAIKILKEHVEWCDPVKEIDTYNALELGIEALERILYRRGWPSTSWHEPLPSETEE